MNPQQPDVKLRRGGSQSPAGDRIAHQPYFLPLLDLATGLLGLAAGFAAGLGAGFLAAAAFGASFFTAGAGLAGAALDFTAGFAAGFVAGLVSLTTAFWAGAGAAFLSALGAGAGAAAAGLEGVFGVADFTGGAAVGF